jgi:exopolysaccharide production protein ExoZ
MRGAPFTQGIQSLQAARGIAALLVVICHSSAFLGREPDLWQRTQIYLWWRGTVLGVQMFFVISGIVIFRAHRQDLNQPRKASAFCWKRFRRVYPLYWICLSLTLLKHHAAPSVIASNYLLIHLFSYQTIMVQAWTLFDEVQFYLVFAVCLLNRRIGFVLLGAWLLASLVVMGSSSPYLSVVFSPYHLLFGIGMLIELGLTTEQWIPARPLLWLGVIVFGGAMVVAGPFERGVVVRLVGGMGAASLLLGAALLERRHGLTLPRWLTLLGDASYSIYLVHFMVISAVARFAYSHLRQLPIPIGGWMVCFVAIGVGAGIVTHHAIELPLLRLCGKQWIRPV